MTFRSQIEAFAEELGLNANYSPYDIATLVGSELIHDASVVEYFQSVPETTIEHEIIKIISATQIRRECEEAIPCCYIAKFGFVPIASDMSGDPFCVDVTCGNVYLISHDIYEGAEISPGWNADTTAFLPNLPINRETIIETSEGCWDSIAEFLEFCLAVAKGELDMD